MQPNPEQTDPEFQSPIQPDTEQQSQPDPGMQSQAGVPPQSGTNVNAQPSVPGAGQMVPPEGLVPGADVYGMEGKKVGTVREVYNDSFLVQKGIFFLHDYYIPYRYVAGVTNNEVNLTLMSHDVHNQTWDQRSGATPNAQPVPPSQPGQTGQPGTNPTAGGTTTPSPQASPNYGTGYGTQQGSTPSEAGQTPPYGDYGPAGSTDTMQDATNRGLQDDLGGAPPPLNTDPGQWESDAQGMRDL
jgi:hypothetical protein